MKFLRKTSVIIVIGLGLSGCMQAHDGPKQTGGTLIGAGLGALAGAQIGQGRGRLAAVAIGALTGAALDNEIGRSLDRADRLQLSGATKAAYQAPLGKKIRWENPNSGNFGSVTPSREGRHQHTGARCRKIENRMTVRGRSREYVGVACQARDGSWTVM